MINVHAITDMQCATVARWHETDITNPYEGLLELACEQHTRNYRLWHQEDIARSLDVSDAEIAQVKRNIDSFNQQRNDHIEKLDAAIIGLLGQAGVTPSSNAPLNTETPGSAIDRLSIMSLRMYHMQEQVDREDADPAHREKALVRLETCREQHHDLSNSLVELLEDLFAGSKCLRVYHQFKMYNDPTMNPYLYARQKPAA